MRYKGDKKTAQIIEEARTRGERFYFTGLPCIRGHVAKRYIAGGTCVECMRGSENRLATEAPPTKFRSEKQKRIRQLIAEAREKGEHHYFTGDPCKYGHTAPRLISTGNCVACGPMRDKRFRESRPDYVSSTRVKVRNAKNAKLRRIKDRTKARAASRRNYWDHVEKRRKSTAQWRRSNPGASNAQRAARKAVKLRSTPKWASKKAINAIYREAAQRSKADGVSYHVDHVVPLRHRLVCGLHCEANLQILTAKENLTKHNSWWPDMP